MLSSSPEKSHSAMMSGQITNYGCSDMLNFGARLRLDDVTAPTLGTGSKSTFAGPCAGGGMDDFGTHLLLLQAAAEAAAAAGLQHHHQQHQQTMPSLGAYGNNRDSAVDVLAAAEQLIGAVASGCRSSAFDALPPSSYWSQIRGRQPISDCDLFDTWTTSTGASSAAILQSLPHQSAAAPESTASSSTMFRQYPGLLPEIDSTMSAALDAVNLPWLCGAAALPSSSGVSRHQSRGAVVAGNRWMESQSPSSSSTSSLASESALPGSPVTTGFSTSTVCLF
jgi:hypothetical protein